MTSLSLTSAFVVVLRTAASLSVSSGAPVADAVPSPEALFHAGLEPGKGECFLLFKDITNQTQNLGEHAINFS